MVCDSINERRTRLCRELDQPGRQLQGSEAISENQKPSKTCSVHCIHQCKFASLREEESLRQRLNTYQYLSVSPISPRRQLNPGTSPRVSCARADLTDPGFSELIAGPTPDANRKIHVINHYPKTENPDVSDCQTMLIPLGISSAKWRGLTSRNGAKMI